MVDTILELDKRTEGNLNVIFAAADLSKIPRHSPEELNEVAMLQRIESLESKFSMLENGVSTSSIAIGDMKDRLKVQEDTSATHEKLIMAVSEQKETSEKV